MKFDKRLLTIFVILICEVLGFSLVLPFLPFWAQDLGASPLVVGLILASFSFFQFFSAPIMGMLSDSFGRKPMLLFSQASTFLGFLILGFSNSLWMIFLSRVIDGLLGSNFSIAQAYLSDISTKKNRSKVFGISGMAFGFGFLVGPAVGGFLSRFSYSVPAFAAAAISLVTIIATLFFLPETVKKKKKVKLDIKIIGIQQFKTYFTNKKISSKLWQFYSYLLALFLWVSIFALYTKKQFGFTASSHGYLLAYIGFVNIIVRGPVLGRAIDYLGEYKLKVIGSILMITGLLATSFVYSTGALFVVMTFFAVGSGLLRPLLVGAISKSVSSKHQGSIMGLTNSLGSTAQIIGPLVGGFMINYYSPASPGILAAAIMIMGLLLILKSFPRDSEVS